MTSAAQFLKGTAVIYDTLGANPRKVAARFGNVHGFPLKVLRITDLNGRVLHERAATENDAQNFFESLEVTP